MAKGKKTQKVMTYGRKKHAVAVATCKNGRGAVRVNGVPLGLVQPPGLRLKLSEPILIAGKEKFAGIDIRVRVRGGGQVSQVYSIRQALARALVAYNQKYNTEQEKLDIKAKLASYDKTLLVADNRMSEPKKFGGHGARARRAKSYR